MNVVLAWLVAEDEGAREKIQGELHKSEETLQDLKRSLQGTSSTQVSFSLSPSPLLQKRQQTKSRNKETPIH